MVVYNCHLMKELKVYEIRSFGRSILLLDIVMENETLMVLINHWPSQKNSYEKREIQQKKIEALFQTISRPKILIVGDFNLSDRENRIATNRLRNLGFEDIFGEQRTYYYYAYNRFYSFDKMFTKGVKKIKAKVVRKFHKKVLRNHRRTLIPDYSIFDHFGLSLSMVVD